MPKLAIFASAFLAVLTYLHREYRRLGKARDGVRLRIGVTGTRGKSSVTRLIAAALRGSGLVVVAKTTGSRAVLIHADGREEAIGRTAPASILEQRKLLYLAQREGAEAFVSEIMSVGGECQEVESRDILGLGVCVITNVRIDHVEEQGRTRDEVAEALSRSIPEHGLVVCCEGEDLRALREAAAERGSKFLTARKTLPGTLRPPSLAYEEFEENLSLALEACRLAGVDEARALAAMRDAIPDRGALMLWRWEGGDPRRSRIFANAFAANDTESTLAVIDRVLRVALVDVEDAPTTVGILNLRVDRTERTRQWIEAIRAGHLDRFRAIYIAGAHAGLVKRRAGMAGSRCHVSREKSARALIERIESENENDLLILGLGNIAGLGLEIVGYCEGRGRPYEL